MVRNKGNSAFMTHELTICFCDSCAGKGSRDKYSELLALINKNKMDAFVEVKAIRLKGNHPTSDIYMTLDGLTVDDTKLLHELKMLKKEKTIVHQV